jgi:UDP-N-acetyl-D-glucosamine dehydrogenase
MTKLSKFSNNSLGENAASTETMAASRAQELQFEDLRRRIGGRHAVIGVIGLGYVGLPLSLAAAEKGFTVIGFDVDRDKIDQLNAGQSYIRHIDPRRVTAQQREEHFTATADFSRLNAVDAVLICVPTPLTRQREPDLTYVVQTCEVVARYLKRGQLIVLESTTYPGTTRDVMRPIFERKDLRSGRDFYLAYSPEREDPGNPDFHTTRIPKVVGGDGPHALELACALYGQFVEKIIPVASPEVAEAVKLTENIFRSVNIALVNELKIIYGAMGIDVWDVIEAAKSKPFGFMPFYPGPGLGGHCIPIDPFYLTWKAREFDISTRFIELAGEINTAMPRFVIDRLAQALDERLGRGLKGARILIAGIAYKKNVDDIRESPALKIMQMLEERGAHIAYSDPFIPTIPRTREHPEFAGWTSVELSPEPCFDGAIICTDHDNFDYEMLTQCCSVVVDTRNVCARNGIHSTSIVKS